MKLRNCAIFAIFSVLQFHQLIFAEFAGSFGKDYRNPFADRIESYEGRLAGINEDRIISDRRGGHDSYNGHVTDDQAKLELHGGIPMGVINQYCDDAKVRNIICKHNFINIPITKIFELLYAFLLIAFVTYCSHVTHDPYHEF